MRISVDLGNKYVKAVAENGQRVMFRSVITNGPRRKILPLHKEGVSNIDALQVTVSRGGEIREYYIGKMAERFGTMKEYVFGKARFNSESAIILTQTAIALLAPDGLEPLQVGISFPYGQFELVGDAFCKKVMEYSATLDIAGVGEKTLNLQSVEPYQQGIAALNTIQNEKLHAEGEYNAIVDIGGDTIIVAVVEECSGEFLVHEELSGTLSHGTKDISNVVRQSFQRKYGESIDLDVAERIVRSESVFYNGEDLDLSKEAQFAKDELAAMLRTFLVELWSTKKARIRTVYFVGGGSKIIHEALELKGFHPSQEVLKDAQFLNAIGGLKLLKKNTENRELDGEGAQGERQNLADTKQSSSVPVDASVPLGNIKPQKDIDPPVKEFEDDSRERMHEDQSDLVGMARSSTGDQLPPEQRGAVPGRFAEGKSAW